MLKFIIPIKEVNKEKFDNLNKAYETLMDLSRHQYDIDLL